jgi:uncharacterized delta-60 repeat protein
MKSYDRTTLLGTLAVLATSVVVTPALAAQSGQLDTSFGSGGIAEIQIPGGVSTVAKVLEQSNGDILFATASATASTTPVSTAQIGRLLSNGTLDTSFGTSGLAALADDGMSVTQVDMQLQSNGDILVLGFVEQIIGSAEEAHPKFQRHGLLARFTTSGTLDTSFGSGGIVALTALGNTASTDTPTALLVQSNGLILVGDTVSTSSSSSTAFVIRLETNGSVDESFGDDDGDTALSGTDFIVGLAQQSDSKIIAIGEDDPAVAIRLLPNGTVDTDTAPGTVSTANAEQDGGQPMTMQSNGSYITMLAGASETQATFQLGRFTFDNAADTTFSSPSIAFGNSDSFSQVYGMELLPDGSAVAVGRLEVQVGERKFDQSFGIARVLTNGELDTSFGTDGIVTTAFPSGTGAATAVTVQSDGNIVVGGVAVASSGTEEVAIARYLSGTSTTSTSTAAVQRAPGS